MQKDTAKLSKIMRAGFWLDRYAASPGGEVMQLFFNNIPSVKLGTFSSLQELYISYDVGLSDEDRAYWTELYGDRRE